MVEIMVVSSISIVLMYGVEILLRRIEEEEK